MIDNLLSALEFVFNVPDVVLRGLLTTGLPHPPSLFPCTFYSLCVNNLN
jgi:hypothetical protein